MPPHPFILQNCVIKYFSFILEKKLPILFPRCLTTPNLPKSSRIDEEDDGQTGE